MCFSQCGNNLFFKLTFRIPFVFIVALMEIKDKQIYVCNKLFNALADTKKAPGFVAGLEKNGEFFCIAASQSREYFLSGLDILGIYCFIDSGSLTEDELISCCQENIYSLKVQLDNPIVLFLYQDDESVNIIGKIFNTYYGSLGDISTTYASDNPAMLLRARGKIPLLLEINADQDVMRENIELAIEKIKSTVEIEVVAFLLESSTFILTSNQDESDTSVICGNLPQYIQDSDFIETMKRNKKCSKKKVPLNFDILLQTSGDNALENTVNHSLVIHCQRREYMCALISLPLDVVIACLESSSTYTIYKTFKKAILQQLAKMNECLTSYAKNSEYVCPVPYHFYPDTCSVPFTVIYPSNKTDADLENYRRSLHKILLLPIDRPVIKKLNRHEFSMTKSGYLINPHIGLPPSGVIGGKTSIVFGQYTYHHYMQDHMNDNGWGCAYRSLQTVISWFKFQGYTDKNVPTHAEIQQALVDIGDKTPNFVGSNKWIGSQEVSFCLNHFIQVESKIMCVNSGAEMANKGRELFLHFRDQGTPVMIGGGVLAHTILGVDFNENTGELKFLILDPHYTGGEDLNVIQSKGWCGWKGINFWDQTAFYNLCLPQRPLQI